MSQEKEYISIAEFAEKAVVQALNKFFKAKFKGLNKALKRKKRVS